MRRPTLPLLAVLILVSVVIPACRDSNADDPPTTVPTAPPRNATSSTTTTVPSFEIPPVIDVPYIEKVMAAIDHVDGEATRYVAAKRQIDETFLGMYVSIYTDKYLDLVTQSWYEIAGDNFELLAAEPGDPKTSVVRVIRADGQCILIEAKRDYTAQLRTADPGGARYVALVPLPPERDADNVNPTPWIMSLDGRNDDGSEPKPEDVCLVR